MKYILFIFTALLALNGCGGGSNNSSESLILKGNFNSGQHSSVFHKFMNFIIPSAFALNTNEVRKIVLLSHSDSYEISEVTDGEFSTTVDTT
jgi:hypothetical protein